MMSEYQAVARAVEAARMSSKVMVAQVSADAQVNQMMVDNFKLKEFPFVAMLTKNEEDYQGSSSSRAPVILKGLKSMLQLKTELSLAQEEKGAIEMQAKHFVGNVGAFSSHPVSGHSNAVIMFHDKKTKPRILSNYDAIARTMDHLGLSSKVMVSRLNVDEDRNQEMKEHFELDKFPFFAWLTKGEQDWAALTMSRPEALVAQIHAHLNMTLRPVREEL